MRLLLKVFLFGLLCFSCKQSNIDVNQIEPSGFIRIEGAQFKEDGAFINIGTFEIMDHPVTNAEFEKFIISTGYSAPLHWQNGKIPQGKEDYPVIFVNRVDVDAYITWLSEKTGKVYSLPLIWEYEHAARSGKPSDSKYYWGDDETMLNDSLINYDKNNNRKFDQWEKYLKPAKWGAQNDAGLYQMAGNVWHLVERREDPATFRYTYIVEELYDIDYYQKGGSWSSIKQYLECDYTTWQSPGLRYPDVGFRLLREPDGISWQVKNRQLCAMVDKNKHVSLSWAFLKSDNKQTRFNVYRIDGRFRSHKGIKMNETPIYATSFIDEDVELDKRYEYRIIAVDENGKEKNVSRWFGITVIPENFSVVTKFKPVFKQGKLEPAFGDLEGNGALCCVIRMDNGCKEMSQDPGLPVELEAFSHSGRSLWRRAIAKHANIYGSASNAPFILYDMDSDGRDEVITFMQIGEVNHIAILDGQNGTILKTTPWDEMATDFTKSSTRVLMAVACLDGKTPAIITQTGLYENEVISAYDNQLNKLWTFESFMETSGGGGHSIQIDDLDGDGKHEVICGSTCLNPDGTMKWSTYKQHPDLVSIHDFIPSRPGKEICYIIESFQYAGIYMVDANTGEIIWKNNKDDDYTWSHGHDGWTANIWDGSPGQECVTNRAGHKDKHWFMYSAQGKLLQEPFPADYEPIEWDGDQVRELTDSKGKSLYKYNGTELVEIDGISPNPIPSSQIVSMVDLCGDYRSEIIVDGVDTDGRKTIFVISATEQIEERYISPREELVYRLFIAKNIGGGYGGVYDYDLKK